MATSPVSFAVTLGDQSFSSDPAATDGVLVSLRVTRGMANPVGEARLVLHPFDISAPAAGDPVEINLDAGDGEATVFTGEVLSVEVGLTAMVVYAADALAKLAATDVEGVYDEQTVGAIVGDLLSQAGVDPGTLDDGPTLPSVALHRGPRGLKHVLSLAARGGLDLWTDGAGKAWMQGADAEGEEISFAFGKTLLAAVLGRAATVPDGWEFWGEGAASSAGAEKAHWLPTKLDGVTAAASVSADESGLTAAPGEPGTLPVKIVDGALRSGELAEKVAGSRADARAGRPVVGYAVVLGGVAVEPGALVTLEDLPSTHAAAALAGSPLRVRGVRHTMDAKSGLLTRLEF